MVAAITFDFWDTIAVDDSDEPKRAALGLPTKAEARVRLFVDRIVARYPHITRAQAAEAFHRANLHFRDVWQNGHQTPGVPARLYDAYAYLGLRPGPGEYARLAREVDELVREIETMEIRIPPDFAPGVHDTLPLLAQDYKLGIISDTIHTHGRGLRHLLQSQGLLQYFSYFVFSDEIGAAKPSPRVFRQAALGLGLPPHQIVHIGDRESNDVAGPLAVGMSAILFTGIVDRGSSRTRAHAVCRNFRDLPALVRRLR
ncbi:MAG TPA: HAD family hydrolase [Caldilineaceae bacterium]|nr:HAD family hydrolase [Caldilineaceae bacterium]